MGRMFIYAIERNRSSALIECKYQQFFNQEEELHQNKYVL